MVYRGKPSKACHACRKRRIKCDEIALPKGCSGCVRVGIDCPGYRDPLDAMFVNETKKVVSRQHLRISINSPGRGLADSTAQLGLSFFYRVHTVRRDPSSNVACTLVAEGCLTTAMQALGLAACGSMTGQDKMLIRAREVYCDAIREVNTALRSEVQSREDSTLFAVVLLAYFEALVGSEDKPLLDAWSRHISGTAALIEKRGIEQMQSSDARLLFMIATTNMISNCTRLQMRIPACIHTIWNSLLPDVSKSDPVWRCHSAWLQLVDFYSDVMHRRINPATVVPEALRIDSQFMKCFDEASDEWAFNVRSATQSEGQNIGLPDFIFCHKSPLSAQIWTSIRSGRITLHAIIAKTMWYLSISAPDRSTREATDQIRKSSEVMHTMRSQVLASVPQQVGILPFERAYRMNASSSAETFKLLVPESNRLPILDAARGYHFVWCLVLVARQMPGDKTMRNLLCSYMRLAGRNLGMQQAFTLAEMVENEI